MLTCTLCLFDDGIHYRPQVDFVKDGIKFDLIVSNRAACSNVSHFLLLLSSTASSNHHARTS